MVMTIKLYIFLQKNGEIAAYCRIFSQGIKYPETSIGRVLTNPNLEI
jgi:ElaA protein